MLAKLERIWYSCVLGIVIFFVSGLAYTGSKALLTAHWYYAAFGGVGGVVLFVAMWTLVGWLLLKWMDI